MSKAEVIWNCPCQSSLLGSVKRLNCLLLRSSLLTSSLALFLDLSWKKSSSSGCLTSPSTPSSAAEFSSVSISACPLRVSKFHLSHHVNRLLLLTSSSSSSSLDLLLDAPGCGSSSSTCYGAQVTSLWLSSFLSMLSFSCFFVFFWLPLLASTLRRLRKRNLYIMQHF